MGALGSLFIGLFAYCFKKLNKENTKKRIIILITGCIISLILAIIFYFAEDTQTGKEGAWMFLWFYLLIFGWRLVADIILYCTGRLDKKKDEESKTKTVTEKTEDTKTYTTVNNMLNRN